MFQRINVSFAFWKHVSIDNTKIYEQRKKYDNPFAIYT